MSVEKEYVVVLKDTANYDEFWQDVETETSGLEFIPDRPVAIVNERLAFERTCHYSLTDEEALALKNDPRVQAIDIPPDQNSKYKIGNYAKRTGDYTKSDNSNRSLRNWALLRCGSRQDTFETASVTDSYYGTVYRANTARVEANVYNYILDGTGVDVIICDSGIEWNHPEFKDDNGNSRVQRIDWYATTGVSGTQNANHYRDYDGHGTHVAAIVAGRTVGWAKNANIYSIKVNGLEGSGDSGTGIGLVDHFDIIKLFHRRKPVDPVTGFKRPTIVNASWGFTNSFVSLANVFYRGTVRTGSSVTGNAIYRWMNYGLTSLNNGSQYLGNGWIEIVDSWITDIVKEGVHFVSAAGNFYMKSSAYDDPDFNNYYYETNPTFGPVYYHRGKSPQSNLAIMVGAIEWTPFSSTQERKADFSGGGTGVDIYAPGAGILSACSNTNIHSAVTYNLDSSFKQTSMGGTSQASPQVCGVGALYLQMNPGATPAQLKKWLINNATANTTVYDVASSSNKYFTLNCVWGGQRTYLYNPFAVSQDGAITNLTLENCVLTLK